MGVTAIARAQTALRASTSLAPAEVLALVKQSAGGVKGGGMSLLTSGVQNLGAEVHVEQESEGALALSITSGKRLVELCTFSAVAEADGDKTVLRIGGLKTYKTTQSTVLGFIPVGPKSISGFSPYKRFLDQVAVDLRAADSNATTNVAQPV
jgi:hypothetical protein